MSRIRQNSLATVEFQLHWKSDIGRHRDRYLADPVNFWRDVLPGKINRALMGKQPGERMHFSFHAEEIMPPLDSKQIFTLDSRQFQRRKIKINGHRIEPRFGRFYPKGLLKNLPNVFSGNMQHFRCIGVEPARITVDFNHPLAGKEFELQVTVHDVREKGTDRGGRLTDWMETITNGPGMQVRVQGRPTDFFCDNPFERPDERDDSLFYEKPRLVRHVDSKADEMISALYGRLLQPGMRVLDLMSSWRSHVHESLELKSLVGLGLNREEMESNPQLTEYVLHDLNMIPRLPFDDHAFDAVICSLSVEYMIHPFDVFSDVARILKPQGYLIHTFSNRWFPPKAISIWQELSEFERMGLVLEYFLRSDAYENLETFSARGWPRPLTDRYYPQILTADPVYAAWGQTAA